MLPKWSIIQYKIYINFYVNVPPSPTEILGAKRPAQQPRQNIQGVKRQGEEMDLVQNLP